MVLSVTTMDIPIKITTKSKKSYVEYKFIGGGWYPFLLGAAMFAAIFVPYIIVLFRGTLDPLLPFVSQAAGSPPQSGIFSVALSLSALAAFIGMHLLHMAIRLHKENLETENSQQLVDLLNKAILIPGHLGILGIMIVGGYPLDFHRHNEDWMEVTIIPHLIGAGLLFTGGIFYCILFTYIMSIISPERTSLLRCRYTIISIIIVAAALHAFTVNYGFMNEYFDANRLKTCSLERIEYSLFYNISSFSEWILLVSFVCFFMTSYEEAKNFSLTFTMTFKESTSEPPKKSTAKLSSSSTTPAVDSTDIKKVINNNSTEEQVQS